MESQTKPPGRSMNAVRAKSRQVICAPPYIASVEKHVAVPSTHSTMPRFTLSSHSGSNLPSSCTVLKTEATTRVFTVAGYSQCARKLVGSVLEFDRFRLGDRAYRLKVYPAGFDEESAGFVSVLVTMEDHWDSFLLGRAARTIFIEILDKDGERAVLDNNTARSEQTLHHHNRSKGYVRFVARRDRPVHAVQGRGGDHQAHISKTHPQGLLRIR